MIAADATSHNRSCIMSGLVYESAREALKTFLWNAIRGAVAEARVVEGEAGAEGRQEREVRSDFF